MTCGRTHTRYRRATGYRSDQQMMDEIRAIHDEVNPAETLFVVDSMTGQDAAATAKAFNDALPLSGVVLTKFTTALFLTEILFAFLCHS